MTSGISISTLEIWQEGASRFFLRVEWTSAFKGFCLLLPTENLTAAITICCIDVCFKIVDLIMFQAIGKNVRTSQGVDIRLITASKNNFSEIHVSAPNDLTSTLCLVILSCFNQEPILLLQLIASLTKCTILIGFQQDLFIS